MSPHHAVGLRGFGAIQGNEIVHLRERFAEDCPDLEWIHALATDGDWVIVSGDLRITRNPVERAAWHESGLTAFFFGDAWSRSQYWKKAAELVEWWPEIVSKARSHPRSHGFEIPKSATRMRQIYP